MTFLSRSRSSLEVIALAASILNALSPGFGQRWYLAVHPRDSVMGHAAGLFGEEVLLSGMRREVKIPADAPGPEVVVLCALSLATTYLDDQFGVSRYWARYVAEPPIKTDIFNATIRCILQDIDYALHPLTKPELIEEVKSAMQRVGERVAEADAAAEAAEAAIWSGCKTITK
jgi:hypothetical protein